MKFYTPVPIRFRDLDAMAHVNNAVYFTLVEQGRIDYFQHVIGKRHNWKEFGVLIVRNEIDYLYPIVLEDTVECGVSVSNIGKKSITVEFELVIRKDDNTDIIAARGKNVLVCHDHTKMESALVPTEWIEKFTQFEQA